MARAPCPILQPLATTKRKQPKKKAASSGNGSESAKVTRVDFHYIKGPDFRTIHVDGAIGGLTTSGFLHMAVFAERAAIPTHIVQEVRSDGTLGAEISAERESKPGVVRQMEVDIFMNESTARNIRNWLDEKLEEFQARRERQASIQDKKP